MHSIKTMAHLFSIHIRAHHLALNQCQFRNTGPLLAGYIWLLDKNISNPATFDALTHYHVSASDSL